MRVVAFHHEPVTTHPPEVCASPERRPTKEPDNCQRLGYFDSAESALALLQKHGTPGRPFVVVVRWDVVFYRSFEAHLLNRELFYRASWCRAGGRAHAEDAKCRQLVPVLHGPQPNPTCSDKGGVPDFVFSGPAWAMHAVFDSAVEDLVNGVYREDGCNVNHGVMAGRLAWAEREKGVQLGRYMVHFLEFDYLRNAPDQRRFYHDDRNKCVQALPQPTRDAYYMTTAPGSGRVSPANLTAHDVRAPQGPSVCGPDIYFCACGPMNYAAFDGARTGG